MNTTLNRPPTARELLGSLRWEAIYQELDMTGAKRTSIDHILANRTYLPGSGGLYSKLSEALAKMGMSDLSGLEALVDCKVAEALQKGIDIGREQMMYKETDQRSAATV